jgi:predicted dehydrogenase
MAFNGRYYYAYSDGVNRYWYNQDLSGGPIVEQATHLCDLARYITGDIDLDSVHTVMLRYDDKSGAAITTSDCFNKGRKLIVVRIIALKRIIYIFIRIC